MWSPHGVQWSLCGVMDSTETRWGRVLCTLEWLRLNHSDYAGIEISHKNASQYGEDMPLVSVEYQPKSTNKVPEGTSVFDQDEEDGQ